MSYWRTRVTEYSARVKPVHDYVPATVRIEMLLGLLNKSEKPAVLEGDQSAVPILLILFEDNGEGVSDSALFALINMTPDRETVKSIAGLVYEGSPRLESAHFLLGSWLEKAPKETLSVLIDLLGKEDAVAREYAIELLYSFGAESAPAIPALLKLLGDKSVAADAAAALRRIDPEAARKAGIN